MGTKRSCGSDSDHIRAKMNSSDLALEQIVTQSPLTHHHSRSTSVSLPSVPNWLPVLPLAGFEVSVVAPVVPGVLGGVVAKADCRFRPVGVPFSPWRSQ